VLHIPLDRSRLRHLFGNIKNSLYHGSLGLSTFFLAVFFLPCAARKKYL